MGPECETNTLRTDGAQQPRCPWLALLLPVCTAQAKAKKGKGKALFRFKYRGFLNRRSAVRLCPGLPSIQAIVLISPRPQFVLAAIQAGSSSEHHRTKRSERRVTMVTHRRDGRC